MRAAANAGPANCQAQVARLTWIQARVNFIR